MILQLVLFILLSGACDNDVIDSWETKYPSQNELVQQYDVPFAHVPAIADIVLYEVNLRAFSASGNIKGVGERLDKIKDLGINVVWLMPIYPTAIEKSVGSPYAVSNYLSIHTDFGNREDLRWFVKEAHKRDMAVILDWVANHTAWDHTWIKNDGWYVKDDNGAIIHPPETNWEDVAELNYENKEMCQEMIKALKYWVLETNIDGYRCDYASGVPDGFWKEAIDTLRNIPNRELIMFAESERKELTKVGFDMAFSWPFYNSLKAVYSNEITTDKLFDDHADEYIGFAVGSHPVRWITNHDQSSWDGAVKHFFGDSDAGALSAFVLATYVGGVPLVYSGQEVAHPGKLGFFERDTAKVDWDGNADILKRYEELLNYYGQSDVLKIQELTNYSSGDVVAFSKSNVQNEVLVVVSVRDSVETYFIPEKLEGGEWNDVSRNSTITLSGSLVLEPYEYIILEK